MGATQRVLHFRAHDTGLDADRAEIARQRQRRYRQRQREGLVTLSVTVDEASITALLVSAGYLSPLVADEPKQIAAALEHMLRAIERRNA